MNPTHIEHIGIAVTSLEESIPFFETLLGTTQATENVTATNHNTDLDAHLRYFLDLACIVAQTLRVDAVSLLTHQALARQLQ